MKALLTLLLFSLVVYSTNAQKSSDIKQDQELYELYELMHGSFNSELQSKKDSSYYNISLHMYPIWRDKGLFLYVEQALNSRQDAPYRQRVYEITRIDDNTFSSAVYTLNNEQNWIGKWNTPEDFNSISKSDLVLRNGCEVIMKRLGKGYYKGMTGAKTCESSLRGASYATSEVEIKNGTIVSWDRGMDAKNNQVWGAEKGGYIFKKVN